MTGKEWQTDAQIIDTEDGLTQWPGVLAYPFVQWEPRFARGMAMADEKWRKLILEAKENLLAKLKKYGSNNSDLPLCEDFAEGLDIEVRYLCIKYRMEFRPIGGPCDLTMVGFEADGLTPKRHSIYWRFISGGGMLFAEPQPSEDTFFDASNGVPAYMKTLDFMDW